MENSGAIGGFTQEARDRSTVVAQLFPQNLDRNRAVLGMLGAVDNGGAALTDLLANGVTGESCSGEVLARHAGEANPPIETQQAARSLEHVILEDVPRMRPFFVTPWLARYGGNVCPRPYGWLSRAAADSGPRYSAATSDRGTGHSISASRS